MTSSWRRNAPRRGRGFWYGLTVDVVGPLVMAFTVPVWRGGDRLPATGPVLLASNHVSFVDPLTETAFVFAHGRIPRFLAKAGLWRLPVVGRMLSNGGHVPVHRDIRDAKGAYRDALAALDRGELVLVYPEATFTSDPDGWPMRGRPGIARLALASGAPVYPVATWGGQRVLPRGKAVPRLLPRKTVYTSVGPPVDLSDLAAAGPTRDVLGTATVRIMAAITALLAEIRDGRP